MKKLGTEQKINNKDFSLKIGTTDKQKPVVIYAEYGVFIEPTCEFDYASSINDIRGKINSIADSIASLDSFSKNYIAITDVPIERMQTNKKSFMSVQYYFRTVGNVDYKTVSEVIRDGIVGKNAELTSFINSKGFLCTKCKR